MKNKQHPFWNLARENPALIVILIVVIIAAIVKITTGTDL